MTPKPAAAALDAVANLRQALEWLAASLLPGNDRRYRPQISADKRRQLDRQAQLEKALKQREEARSGMLVPLGNTPAPGNVEIMDLLAELCDAADEMAVAVAVVVWMPAPEPAQHAYTNPGRFLDLISAYLPLAATVDDTIAGWIERKCDGLVEQVHRTLGLMGDGQLLAVICPWCDGRTGTNPAGGDRTMRVRAKLPDGKKSIGTVDPTQVRWYVVCESGTCEPPEADCGERLRGKPAWPLSSEGDWLADRLRRAAEVA